MDTVTAQNLYGKVGYEYRLAVLIAGYGFNETVLGDVFDQGIFDVALHHILAERNKIENIRVFHSLQGKLTLRRSQPIFKICNFFGKDLAFIQTAFDLMNQDIV